MTGSLAQGDNYPFVTPYYYTNTVTLVVKTGLRWDIYLADWRRRYRPDSDLDLDLVIDGQDEGESLGKAAGVAGRRMASRRTRHR